jgi:hypothetical protein
LDGEKIINLAKKLNFTPQILGNKALVGETP